MLFLLVSDTPYIEMKGWHCTKSGYCQKDAVFLKSFKLDYLSVNTILKY